MTCDQIPPLAPLLLKVNVIDLNFLSLYVKHLPGVFMPLRALALVEFGSQQKLGKSLTNSKAISQHDLNGVRMNVKPQLIKRQSLRCSHHIKYGSRRRVR